MSLYLEQQDALESLIGGGSFWSSQLQIRNKVDCACYKHLKCLNLERKKSYFARHMHTFSAKKAFLTQVVTSATMAVLDLFLIPNCQILDIILDLAVQERHFLRKFSLSRHLTDI